MLAFSYGCHVCSKACFCSKVSVPVMFFASAPSLNSTHSCHWRCILSTHRKSRSRTRGVADTGFRVPMLGAEHIFFVLRMERGALFFSFCDTSQLILLFLVLQSVGPGPHRSDMYVTDGWFIDASKVFSSMFYLKRVWVHVYSCEGSAHRLLVFVRVFIVLCYP